MTAPRYEAVQKLIALGVPDEALGTWRPGKKVLWLRRPDSIQPVARAWRLGALLLDRNGNLYATGSVTRAIVPKDFNSDKSIAGDERREIQRAAARGRFRQGEAVNYDWQPLTAEAARTLVAPATLETYISDRIALLT